MRLRVSPSLRVAPLLPTLSVAALLACNQNKLDQDGDGFTELTGDCDDLDANVHPEAQEVCYNGIDDNCNGEEDEEGATSGRIWYLDVDGDGYGIEEATLAACDQPEGYASEKWDCRDDEASIFPNAPELCDYIDNDCDGEVDEATSEDALQWYPDRDGDGYGDAAGALSSCESPGPGWLQAGGDCNDADPLVSPEQTESCLTSFDDDCDGLTDAPDAYGCTDWYADLDGDGFAGTVACLCEADSVYTEPTGEDCDDQDAEVYPGNGLVDEGWSDRNCDSTVDRTLAEADIILEVDDTSLLNNGLIRMRTFGAGDLDGDRLDDLVLGLAQYGSNTAGSVLVANGATLGEEHQVYNLPTATVSPVAEGMDSSSILYGIATHRPLVEDLNLDGYGDLILSQRTNLEGTARVELAVFLGPVSGALDMNGADSTLAIPVGTHSRHGARLLHPSSTGAAYIGVGDSTADTSFGSNRGAVHLLEWSDGLQTGVMREGIVSGQRLGDAYDSAGDFDGDGRGDSLIASNSTYGSDLFLETRSALGGVLEVFTDDGLEPQATIVSNAYYRYIYHKFGGPGDLNGDGYADLVFSAESNIYAWESGRVHVVWGPLEGVVELAEARQTVILGTFEGQGLHHPSAIPDTTGDGRDDLLIGAYYGGQLGDDAPRGTSYLWPGADLDATLLAGDGMVVLDDGLIGSNYGAPGYSDNNYRPSGSIGDINGDGFGELLIRGGLSVEEDPDSLDSLFLFLGGSL